MDQGSKNKKTSVQLFCEHQNPGPNYKLKSLLGYKEHCPSKTRKPAYSIRGRQKDVFSDTPGPDYLYDSYLTHQGRQLPKSTIITSRPKTKKPEVLPGPGLYESKSFNRSKSFTLGVKLESVPSISPAPNAYRIQSGIGSKNIFDKNSNSSTIRSRPDFGNIYYLSQKAKTPGPGSYNRPESRRSKSVTIKGRRPLDSNSALDTPAPGSYNIPSFVGSKKGFSIGIKHSPHLMPVTFDATI